MGLPTGQDVLDFLSGYEINTIISPEWIGTRILNFVIPWIESTIRQPIGRSQQVTEYLSGNGDSLLLLSARPIISLDQLAYVLMGNSSTYILDLSSVEVIQYEGILKAKRSMEMNPAYAPVFAKGDRNIKVTYTIGYVDTPEDICEAILYFASEQVLGHIANLTGGGDIQTEGYSRSFGARGRYSNERNDLARQGWAILTKYISGVVG